jgi:LPPG:FO 2-phospho-L-lactate transferase
MNVSARAGNAVSGHPAARGLPPKNPDSDPPGALRVTALAGGVGGAKLAAGLQAVLPAGALSIVVNTADDLTVHGLYVSPDLDTVMYTLAGMANPDTGWGLREETWSAAAMLERYGVESWFRLGDGDLATHILRTERMAQGETLSQVTAELARALGVPSQLLPMTDTPVRTRLLTDRGELDFQDYFVRRRHADDVRAVTFRGIASARPPKAVRGAIAEAGLIAIGPSNPFVSVGAILAVPGLLAALVGAPAPVVAVSPIVAGAALRGPADRMFITLGGEPSALGVARHYVERYPGLLDGLVIDEQDADQEPTIRSLGLHVAVTDTVMTDEARRIAVARQVLALGRRIAES